MNHQDSFQPKRSAIILAVAALAFIGGLLGCASQEARVTETAPGVEVETVADRAAREAEAAYFVDVEFQKGSSLLTEQSRASIASLLNRARAEGELNDVKVLSWADDEYPSARRKKLSSAQRRLASLRNQSVERHVKSLPYDVRVETHNMAQRPSVVSRWFNTSDARFKRSLVAAGLPTTAESEPITGRASHAIVLVTLK